VYRRRAAGRYVKLVVDLRKALCYTISQTERIPRELPALCLPEEE
jgi:hypothetical protein